MDQWIFQNALTFRWNLRIHARADGVGVASINDIKISSWQNQIGPLSLMLQKEGGTVISIALDGEKVQIIPSASFSLLNSERMDSHATVLRNPNGTLILSDISPRTYTARFSTEGYADHSQNLIVEAGKVHRVESVLSVAGSLDLCFTGFGREELTQMQLMLKPTDQTSLKPPKAGLPAGPLGRWVIRGLLPGNYLGKIEQQGKPTKVIPITIRRQELTVVETGPQ